MTPRDTLAAVGVAVVWGLTFIAIKVGVAETWPLMLSALRFVFAAFPAVLFVGPPKAPPWMVVLYGLLLGEPSTPVELAGGVLVMAGLALNAFGDRALRCALSFR